MCDFIFDKQIRSLDTNNRLWEAFYNVLCDDWNSSGSSDVSKYWGKSQ